MERREFIRDLALFSGGIALACSSLGNRAMAMAESSSPLPLRASGFGDLVPTAAKNT